MMGFSDVSLKKMYYADEFLLVICSITAIHPFAGEGDFGAELGAH